MLDGNWLGTGIAPAANVAVRVEFKRKCAVALSITVTFTLKPDPVYEAGTVKLKFPDVAVVCGAMALYSAAFETEFETVYTAVYGAVPPDHAELNPISSPGYVVDETLWISDIEGADIAVSVLYMSEFDAVLYVSAESVTMMFAVKVPVPHDGFWTNVNAFDSEYAV